MTDNEALNQIAGDTTKIERELYVAYTDIVGGAKVTTPAEREENIDAIRTVVLNYGPTVVVVSEDGIPMMIVAANDSRELPVPGRGVITVAVHGGSGGGGSGGGGEVTQSEVAISTYIYQPPA